MPLTLDRINALDRDGFVAAFGGLYEHSPWAAEAAWAERPFADAAALRAALARAVDAAPEARQVELLRAHPDLAGKAARAGDLTRASTAEQAGAGLDRLSDAEYDRFTRLNDAYRSRFGFPFILAVKGHTRHTILDAFERRLGHDAATERAAALAEVHRIAGFRLEALTDPDGAPPGTATTDRRR